MFPQWDAVMRFAASPCGVAKAVYRTSALLVAQNEFYTALLYILCELLYYKNRHKAYGFIVKPLFCDTRHTPQPVQVNSRAPARDLYPCVRVRGTAISYEVPCPGASLRSQIVGSPVLGEQIRKSYLLQKTSMPNHSQGPASKD